MLSFSLIIFIIHPQHIKEKHTRHCYNPHWAQFNKNDWVNITRQRRENRLYINPVLTLFLPAEHKSWNRDFKDFAPTSHPSEQWTISTQVLKQVVNLSCSFCSENCSPIYLLDQGDVFYRSWNLLQTGLVWSWICFFPLLYIFTKLWPRPVSNL